MPKPIFSKDGNYIIYTNYQDNFRLYKKSIGDESVGNPITSSAGFNPTLSPN